MAKRTTINNLFNNLGELAEQIGEIQKKKNFENAYAEQTKPITVENKYGEKENRELSPQEKLNVLAKMLATNPSFAKYAMPALQARMIEARINTMGIDKNRTIFEEFASSPEFQGLTPAEKVIQYNQSLLGKYDAQQNILTKETLKRQGWKKEQEYVGEDGYKRTIMKNASTGEMREIKSDTKVRSGGSAGRVGMMEGNLIKSYQNSFNKDPIIMKMKEMELSGKRIDGMIALAKAGNVVAAQGLGISMAKTLGETGNLSRADVTYYVQTKQLSRRAGDALLSWIEGRPSDATLDDIAQIASVLKDSYAKSLSHIIDSHVEQMSKNPALGMTPEEARQALATQILYKWIEEDNGTKGDAGVQNKTKQPQTQGRETKKKLSDEEVESLIFK